MASTKSAKYNTKICFCEKFIRTANKVGYRTWKVFTHYFITAINEQLDNDNVYLGSYMF